jgi:hypothetical protein
MTFVPFRRPVRRSVHALDHLATLSDVPELCLTVSERTLYILQNLSTLDAIDAYQYAKSMEEGGYVPVAEEDDEWALYRSVCNALQLELIEQEYCTVPLSHICATTIETQLLKNNEDNTILYDDVLWDDLSEYDPETGTIGPLEPGIYDVSASILIDTSAAWEASERAVLSVVQEGGGEVATLGYQRIVSTASQMVWLAGSARVKISEGASYFIIRLYQNSDASLYLNPTPARNMLFVDRLI